ncbi:hypothetical protein OIO90_005383 [Microbotryomycetes sp. JL221]|nr:hypothetical protein OIO90_005383 [Microbotryomycetes sp. JL221]
MDLDQASQSTVSPQDSLVDSTFGKHVSASTSASSRRNQASKAKEEKRLPACDNCKRRRLKCFPVPQPGSCPRCSEEQVQCTTTPVVRRRPVRKPKQTPSATSGSRQPSREPSPVFALDEVVEGLAKLANQQQPQIAVAMEPTTQAGKLLASLWAPEYVQQTLRGKVAVELLEASTHSGMYAHPILPMKELLNELKVAQYDPLRLSLPWRTLVYCLFSHGASISISPTILGPGPVPQSYGDLSRLPIEDFAELGRRRQQPYQSILRETRRLAKEAEITVEVTRVNAASCILLGGTEIIFAHEVDRGRAYIAAYYAHIRILVKETGGEGVRWASYALSESLGDLIMNKPILFSEEDTRPWRNIATGPSLQELLVDERKEETRQEIGSLWKMISPISFSSLRMVRRVQNFARSLVDDPINEQELLNILEIFDQLLEAQKLVLDHVDRHVELTKELFPNYVRQLSKYGTGSSGDRFEKRTRNLVLLSPAEAGSREARQQDRIGVTINQIHALTLTCARQAGEVALKTPSLPHITHMTSFPLEEWAEILLDNNAGRDSICAEDVPSLEGLLQIMQLSLFSVVDDRRSEMISRVQARLQTLSKPHSPPPITPFLDTAMLGLMSSVQNWDGGELNADQWLAPQNGFYGLDPMSFFSAPMTLPESGMTGDLSSLELLPASSAVDQEAWPRRTKRDDAFEDALTAASPDLANEDSEVHVTSETINAPEQLELSRVQLAAALIDYDAALNQGDDIGVVNSVGPSQQAQRSAILAPYRHLLLAQSPSNAGLEANHGSAGWTATIDHLDSSERAADPHQTLQVSRSDAMSRPDMPLGTSVDASNRLLNDADHEEERLRDEWGINSTLDSVASGFGPSSAGLESPTTTASLTLQQDASVWSRGSTSQVAVAEAHRLALGNNGDTGIGAAGPSSNTSEQDSVGSGAATGRKLRILERRSSDGKLRPDSLHVATLPGLGATDQLPSFDGTDDHIVFGAGRRSVDLLTRPSVDEGARTSSRLSMFSTASSGHRLSVYSLGTGFDGRSGATSRASMTADRPKSTASVSPRPLSALSLNVGPGAPDARSALVKYPTQDNEDERPLLALSQRGGFNSGMTPTTPVSFTSRFDPAMIALARAEIENDRPQFVNKDAGAPPKIVMMPAPLAGQPLLPPKKPRVEGPDSDVDEEEATMHEGHEDQDEEAERAQRPAGALYGRSLMDVMEERRSLVKGQARQYVHGADGRRTMMDYGDTPAARRLMARAAAADGEEFDESFDKDSDVARPSNARKRHLSVFGPDLIYQREMEQVKALQAAEEAEQLELAEREEEDRLKKENTQAEKMKRRSKGKLVKMSRKSVDTGKRQQTNLGDTRATGAFSSRNRLTDADTGEEARQDQAEDDAARRLDEPLLPVPSALLEQSRADDWFPSSPRSHSSESGAEATPRAGDQRGDWTVRQVKSGKSRLSLTFDDEDPAKPLAFEENPAENARRGIASLTLDRAASAPPKERRRLVGLRGWNGSQNSDDDSDDEDRKPIRYISEDEDGRGAHGDDEDDVPLALKLAANGRRVDDDDDVPLGVRASMYSGLRASVTINDDSYATVLPVLPRFTELPEEGEIQTMAQDEDDDDQPLGFTAMAYQQRQSVSGFASSVELAYQRHMFELSQQQQQQQQQQIQMQQIAMMEAQRQMAFQVALQQAGQGVSFMSSEMGSNMGYSNCGPLQPGLVTPSGSATGNRVEDWRRGVYH